jgi:hypothetical protein
MAGEHERVTCSLITSGKQREKKKEKEPNSQHPFKGMPPMMSLPFFRRLHLLKIPPPPSGTTGWRPSFQHMGFCKFNIHTMAFAYLLYNIFKPNMHCRNKSKHKRNSLTFRDCP